MKTRIGCDFERRQVRHASLNRKDFGLTWTAALETGGFVVGDGVRITLSIQAIALSSKRGRPDDLRAWCDMADPNVRN